MALVRHRDFGGPSWLWSALDHRHKVRRAGGTLKPMKGIDEFRVELYEGFHSLWNAPSTNDDQLVELYPACYGAASAWSDQSPMSSRWLLEALLLTEASDVKSADALGESPATVRAFRELFFDVSKGRDKPMWMQKYVWGPAANSSNSIYYVNFIYKTVAHYGGLKLLETLLSATITDPANQEWFVNFVMTERMRKSLQFSSNYARLDIGGRSAVLENVVSDWSKLKDNRDDGDMGSSLKSLAEAVSGTMMVMGLDETLPSKEVVSIDMYKDEDIK